MRVKVTRDKPTLDEMIGLPLEKKKAKVRHFPKFIIGCSDPAFIKQQFELWLACRCCLEGIIDRRYIDLIENECQRNGGLVNIKSALLEQERIETVRGIGRMKTYQGEVDIWIEGTIYWVRPIEFV